MASLESQLFSYHALRADGTTEKGVLESPTLDDAKDALTTRGLFTIEVREQPRGSRRRLPMSASDLAVGLRMLADLLDSGLPMERALYTLEEMAPPIWRNALPALRETVREGQSLTAALSSSDLAIPSLTLGILHAGEAGSGIVDAVRRAADIAESSAAARAATRSALAYPMLVAAAGIGAVGVLLGVVLPRFAAVLADLGQALPPSTQFVLAAARFFRAWCLPLAGAIALIVVTLRGWISTEAGGRKWGEILLSLPVIGSVRHAIATSRSCTSLAALLEIGVPIGQALEHAARAAGDSAVERRLLGAKPAIASGESLASALDHQHAFTPIAMRLLHAGERSGRVVSMLQHAARMEQGRADRSIATGLRMLEPILLLAFASLVALVAASLLQAIYSVRPQ